MAVRVRMFAALREAAGTGETSAAPGPLPAILDELCERYGHTFARRLAIASVLVDGHAVHGGKEAPDVADGAEVALLPPVSGGSRLAGAKPPTA